GAGAGHPPARGRRGLRRREGQGFHPLPSVRHQDTGGRTGGTDRRGGRMSKALTVERDVHFNRTSRGRGYRKELRVGPEPEAVDPGRVPRVARLMALAIRFDRLIRDGEIANYAELARLGHVTTARITH